MLSTMQTTRYAADEWWCLQTNYCVSILEKTNRKKEKENEEEEEEKKEVHLTPWSRRTRGHIQNVLVVSVLSVWCNLVTGSNGPGY